MLKEHYRCHPKIINFCNKKFYNNELVIMTEDKDEQDVIKVIKTNKGNHKRDNTSQRQLDIIKEILPKLKTNDIGIITPYNNQVNLIKENTKDIEVSTVHKFQGREKDIIIISTVDDEISDFVADSNILNVAISRAKKELIFIVTGNNIKNQNIKDFIDYTKYINMEVEESNIYSVFDLLYKQYEKERLDYFKKHKKISNYDSENIMYHLLNKVLEDYKDLTFTFRYPVNILIKDKTLLTEEERKYASHHNTHVDFLIYNEISKIPLLVIEVDGYKYHKEDNKQKERDILVEEIEDVLRQMYVLTATWGLDYWENMLYLPRGIGKTYEERRSIILTKMRGSKTTTIEVVKQLAYSFFDVENVTVEEDNAHYIFNLTLENAKFESSNFSDLINAIELYKPAHLNYSFAFVSKGTVVINSSQRIALSKLPECNTFRVGTWWKSYSDGYGNIGKVIQARTYDGYSNLPICGLYKNIIKMSKEEFELIHNPSKNNIVDYAFVDYAIVTETESISSKIGELKIGYSKIL